MIISGDDRNKKDRIKRTGGEWFVRILQDSGIEFVFGTTGAGMPHIQDAMVLVKPPKWIQGLHEFVSVSAASGYALASRKNGVALIDRLVGTQNAIGAIYAAYLNSSPVTIFASSNLPGVPIPDGGIAIHFSSNQSSLAKPWLKWSAEVHSLDTLDHDVDKALYLALSEHQGPTYATLRRDLMARQVEEIRERRPAYPQNAFRVPDDSTLEKIVSEILGHNSPQIVVSHAGRIPETVESIVNFAHLFGCGVSDRRVFMNYPMTDPLHQGFVGLHAQPMNLIESADLAISLEVGLLPHQEFDSRVDVIDIVSDPMHCQDVNNGGDYGSSLFPAKIRTISDVKPTLDKLIRIGLSKLTTTKDKEVINERISSLSEAHTHLFAEWKKKSRNSFESEKFDPWSVGYLLNHALSKEEYTWVNGTNTAREALLKALELSKPGSYFSNPSGHLGSVIGMAYGVALAHRHYSEVKDMHTYRVGSISPSSHIVVCTTGDGDAIFGNLPSALWTCSHYGIGVLYIIMNNACWGVEWPAISRTYQHYAKDANDFEFVDLDNPRTDFQKIAEAFSVQSVRVQNIKDLETSLPDLLRRVKNGMPALVDVQLEKFTGGTVSVVP
jgi:thiamine pyrophosphate-dependent acetolactate synthase large subunit-like protein